MQMNFLIGEWYNSAGTDYADEQFNLDINRSAGTACSCPWDQATSPTADTIKRSLRGVGCPH
jgi:hypothetical protein